MKVDYNTRLTTSKDPGPESPALANPRGMIWMITLTRSVQVSGFRCQQPKSTPWIGVAHKMDLLSPVLDFRCNTLSVGDSGLDFY